MPVEIRESVNMDDLLKRLPVEVRTKAIPSSLRASLRPAANRAKQLAPRGDKAHNPSAPPLYTTIKVVIREYGETIMGIMGASWPQGAHAHLVERGHKLVAWGHPTRAFVPGKEFMAPAVDSTQTEQRRKMIQKLVDMIKKAGG